MVETSHSRGKDRLEAVSPRGDRGGRSGSGGSGGHGGFLYPVVLND